MHLNLIFFLYAKYLKKISTFRLLKMCLKDKSLHDPNNNNTKNSLFFDKRIVLSLKNK